MPTPADYRGPHILSPFSRRRGVAVTENALVRENAAHNAQAQPTEQGTPTGRFQAEEQ